MGLWVTGIGVLGEQLVGGGPAVFRTRIPEAEGLCSCLNSKPQAQCLHLRNGDNKTLGGCDSRRRSSKLKCVQCLTWGRPSAVVGRGLQSLLSTPSGFPGLRPSPAAQGACSRESARQTGGGREQKVQGLLWWALPTGQRLESGGGGDMSVRKVIYKL